VVDLKSIFRRRVAGVRSVSYSFESNKVLIVPLGDVHLGAPTCDIDKFQRTVNWIATHDCYVVLMGDLLEAASRHSVGAGWVEQTISPQDQLDALHECLAPIAHKVLVLLDGNHEDRIWKQSGIMVSKTLATLLGVHYGGYSCYIKVRVQKQNYVIYAQHGSSNAWYPHTKLTAAMRTARHTDADIYLYGHTHELLSIGTPKRYMNLRSRTVQNRKQYFVLTGGFLKYHGSYAERKNMYPVKTGVANIWLSGDRWDVHCST
jgi:predicted phosphodiesterase